MQPQKETKEKRRKTKFIILIGPRDRRHGTPHRATWERHRVVRRQGQGEHLAHGLSGGFFGRGKAGQGEQFRTG